MRLLTPLTPLVDRLPRGPTTTSVIARVRRGAAVLLFLGSLVSAIVWWSFSTGPIEFERRTIHIATVGPINDRSTLEITTLDGETFRLFESLYRRADNRIWRRDGIVRVLREADSMDVWLAPGQQRIQGFIADSASAGPSIGYGIESARRYRAGILPLLFLFFGLVALMPPRSRTAATSD